MLIISCYKGKSRKKSKVDKCLSGKKLKVESVEVVESG
jgi:hypothetical protein